MTSSEDQAHWIGDYRIEGELGRGAMGAVYRVMHRSGQGPFALKLLLPETLDDSRALKRFQNEAQSMKTLSEHPGIVSVFQQGFANQGPFVVMELVEGENLRNLLKRGAFSEREALEHVGAVTHALAYAHDHGFVHRDVKPENVMITSDGRALLTDFGVTRVLGSLDKLTRTGELLGTPVYMAPEQVSTELGPVCAATDVYAVGVILYQLLLGRSPYEATSTVTLLSKVMNGEPFPGPRALRPRLHPAWQEVVERALERRPAERYPHAGALAVDLDAALAGPVEQSRGRGLAAGALLLGAAGLGAALLLRRPAAEPGATPAPTPAASAAEGVAEAELERAWSEARWGELQAALARADEDQRDRYGSHLRWLEDLEDAWRPEASADALIETLARVSGEAEGAGDAAALEPHLSAHAKARVFLREEAPARALALPGEARFNPRLGPLALWAEGAKAEAALGDWPAAALPAARARAAAWTGDVEAARASLAALEEAPRAALAWELAPYLGRPDAAPDVADLTRGGWGALAQAEHLWQQGERLLAAEALARVPLGVGGERGALAHLAHARLRFSWGDVEGARRAWRQSGACFPGAGLGARWAWARLGAELALAEGEAEQAALERWRPGPLRRAPLAGALHEELSAAQQGALGTWGRVALTCWQELGVLERAGHVTELAPIPRWLKRLARAQPRSALVQLAQLRVELLTRPPEESAEVDEALCARAPYWGRLLQARRSVARARVHVRAGWRARLAQAEQPAPPYSKADQLLGVADTLYGLATQGLAQLPAGSAPPDRELTLGFERAGAILERARLAWIHPGAGATPQPRPELVRALSAYVGPHLSADLAQELVDKHEALLKRDSPQAAAELVAAAMRVDERTTQAWAIRAGLDDAAGRVCARLLQIAWGDAPACSVRTLRRLETTLEPEGVVFDLRVPFVRYRRAAGLNAKGAEPEGYGELLAAARAAFDLYPLVARRLGPAKAKEIAAFLAARPDPLLAAVVAAEQAEDLAAQRAALRALSAQRDPAEPALDLAALSLFVRWSAESPPPFPKEALARLGSLRARRLIQADPSAAYPWRVLAALNLVAPDPARSGLELVDRCWARGFPPELSPELEAAFPRALAGEPAALAALRAEHPRSAVATFFLRASGGIVEPPARLELGEQLFGALARCDRLSDPGESSNRALLAAATDADQRGATPIAIDLALRALELAHPGGTPRRLRPERRLRQLQPLPFAKLEQLPRWIPPRLGLRAASASLLGGARPALRVLARAAGREGLFHPFSRRWEELLRLEDPACAAELSFAPAESPHEFERDLYLRQHGAFEAQQLHLIRRVHQLRLQALRLEEPARGRGLELLARLVERAPFPLRRQQNPVLLALREALALDRLAGGAAAGVELPAAEAQPLFAGGVPLDRLRVVWHRVRLALAQGQAPSPESLRVLRRELARVGLERARVELGPDPWLKQARAALPEALAGL